MPLQKLDINNFTVFTELHISFSDGINVFIGQNGVGKTHIMKILYSACKATSPKISFPQKMVHCFYPDDHKIGRLVRRGAPGNEAASLRITAQGSSSKANVLSAKFSRKTAQWNADMMGEDGWRKQLSELNCIFIPAKEILSHSYNLNAAVEMNNVSFDDTYLDIINSAKIAITAGKDSATKRTLLDKMETIIAGKVFFDKAKDEFYLKEGNTKTEFTLIAEGIRKIALLWQLIKNGALLSGSILFWDEPEANINPAHIPLLAEMLMELQREGVQIFIATHDYFLVKYLDVKRGKEDRLKYHSFFMEDGCVRLESAAEFRDLQHNAIMETFLSLYEEEIEKEMQS